MYAIPKDILDRYAETGLFLAGRTPEGEADEAPLFRALEEAGGEIDAALRGRYQLPLAAVPPLLRRVAVDLAVDSLPRNGSEYADLFERRARTARELLKSLASGVNALDVPQITGTASGSGMAVYTPESDFRQTLDGM